MGPAGARNWTLRRNLRTPSLWTEEYSTPTWMDFLRLNHRLTATDKEVGDRLNALHDGDHPPEPELSIERGTGAIRGRTQPITRISRP
ncbi:MFS transporter [Ensifer aridi]|uniref:MFS transporter n=1 Tax=Ensifer aridi TaxID=1708715 RepID=UPI00358EC1BC